MCHDHNYYVLSNSFITFRLTGLVNSLLPWTKGGFLLAYQEGIKNNPPPQKSDPFSIPRSLQRWLSSFQLKFLK